MLDGIANEPACSRRGDDTEQEVSREMYQEARPLRKESRNWKEYAARMAGDIAIAAFEPTPEKILSFHQEAERLEATRIDETKTAREALRLHMCKRL